MSISSGMCGRPRPRGPAVSGRSVISPRARNRALWPLTAAADRPVIRATVLRATGPWSRIAPSTAPAAEARRAGGGAGCPASARRSGVGGGSGAGRCAGGWRSTGTTEVPSRSWVAAGGCSGGAAPGRPAGRAPPWALLSGAVRSDLVTRGGAHALEVDMTPRREVCGSLHAAQRNRRGEARSNTCPHGGHRWDAGTADCRRTRGAAGLGTRPRRRAGSRASRRGRRVARLPSGRSTTAYGPTARRTSGVRRLAGRLQAPPPSRTPPRRAAPRPCSTASPSSISALMPARTAAPS